MDTNDSVKSKDGTVTQTARVDEDSVEGSQVEDVTKSLPLGKDVTNEDAKDGIADTIKSTGVSPEKGADNSNAIVALDLQGDIARDTTVNSKPHLSDVVEVSSTHISKSGDKDVTPTTASVQPAEPATVEPPHAEAPTFGGDKESATAVGVKCDANGDAGAAEAVAVTVSMSHVDSEPITTGIPSKDDEPVNSSNDNEPAEADVAKDTSVLTPVTPVSVVEKVTDEVSSDSEKQQGEVVVDVSHETRSAPNVSDRVGAVATTTPASADANNGTPNALPTKASEESSTVPVSEPIVPTPADQTSPDSEEVSIKAEERKVDDHETGVANIVPSGVVEKNAPTTDEVAVTAVDDAEDKEPKVAGRTPASEEVQVGQNSDNDGVREGGVAEQDKRDDKPDEVLADKKTDAEVIGDGASLADEKSAQVPVAEPQIVVAAEAAPPIEPLERPHPSTQKSDPADGEVTEEVESIVIAVVSDKVDAEDTKSGSSRATEPVEDVVPDAIVGAVAEEGVTHVDRKPLDESERRSNEVDQTTEIADQTEHASDTIVQDNVPAISRPVPLQPQEDTTQLSNSHVSTHSISEVNDNSRDALAPTSTTAPLSSPQVEALSNGNLEVDDADEEQDVGPPVTKSEEVVEEAVTKSEEPKLAPVEMTEVTLGQQDERDIHVQPNVDAAQVTPQDASEPQHAEAAPKVDAVIDDKDPIVKTEQPKSTDPVVEANAPETAKVPETKVGEPDVSTVTSVHISGEEAAKGVDEVDSTATLSKEVKDEAPTPLETKETLPPVGDVDVIQHVAATSEHEHPQQAKVESDHVSETAPPPAQAIESREIEVSEPDRHEVASHVADIQAQSQEVQVTKEEIPKKDVETAIAGPEDSSHELEKVEEEVIVKVTPRETDSKSDDAVAEDDEKPSVVVPVEDKKDAEQTPAIVPAEEQKDAVVALTENKVVEDIVQPVVVPKDVAVNLEESRVDQTTEAEDSPTINDQEASAVINATPVMTITDLPTESKQDVGDHDGSDSKVKSLELSTLTPETNANEKSESAQAAVANYEVEQLSATKPQDEVRENEQSDVVDEEVTVNIEPETPVGDDDDLPSASADTPLKLADALGNATEGYQSGLTVEVPVAKASIVDDEKTEMASQHESLATPTESESVATTLTAKPEEPEDLPTPTVEAPVQQEDEHDTKAVTEVSLDEDTRGVASLVSSTERDAQYDDQSTAVGETHGKEGTSEPSVTRSVEDVEQAQEKPDKEIASDVVNEVETGTISVDLSPTPPVTLGVTAIPAEQVPHEQTSSPQPQEAAETTADNAEPDTPSETVLIADEPADEPLNDIPRSIQSLEVEGELDLEPTQQGKTVLSIDATPKVIEAEEEDVPETPLYFSGPSARSAIDMDELADAASAQGGDDEVDESLDDDEFTTRGGGVTTKPVDIGVRPRAGRDELKIEPQVQEDSLPIDRAHTPILRVTAPDDENLSTDTDDSDRVALQQVIVEPSVLDARTQEASEETEPTKGSDLSRTDAKPDMEGDKVSAVTEVSVPVGKVQPSEDTSPFKEVHDDVRAHDSPVRSPKKIGGTVDLDHARDEIGLVGTDTHLKSGEVVIMNSSEASLPEISTESSESVVDETTSQTFGEISSERSLAGESEPVATRSIPDADSNSDNLVTNDAQTPKSIATEENVDTAPQLRSLEVDVSKEGTQKVLLQHVAEFTQTDPPVLDDTNERTENEAQNEETNSAVTEELSRGIQISTSRGQDLDSEQSTSLHGVTLSDSAAKSINATHVEGLGLYEPARAPIPEQPTSMSASWTASYSVTTQGPGMTASMPNTDCENLDMITKSSPSLSSHPYTEEDRTNIGDALMSDTNRDVPLEAENDSVVTDAAEEVPRPKSPYPSSYSVTQQGPGFSPGAVSPALVPADNEVHEATPTVDSLLLTPTKVPQESAIHPAQQLDLSDERDIKQPEMATSRASVVSEQALAYLDKAIEDQNELTPDDSVSDVSASDVPEPAMTPKSDLGITTPGFDTRSEVSWASREPIAPESPRLDPGTPLELETPDSIEVNIANTTPPGKPATIDEAEIEEQHSVQTPLVKLVAVPEASPVLDAVTTKVDEAQESTPDGVEVLSSEERPTDLTSVGINVRSPTTTTGVEFVPDASTHVDTESDPASSSFDADIDSDYPTSSAFSMVGSESVSSDHVERTRAIPGSVHPEPHPTYAGTDSDVSVELVDIESQGLSDVDGVLIESQTIPTKLTAQNTATPTTAPAKTESTIDDDQFSLTSGLTESVGHLSELETISDSSLRVVNVGSIPEIVSQAALSYDEDDTRSMSIHPPTSLMMSPSVPSEMPLTMPTPDGLNPPPYADVAAYAIPGNDNGILTSGTATPRQAQQGPDTSIRSVAPSAPKIEVPKIAEPVPQPFVFPSYSVSREASQSTVGTASSGPSTALTSVPEYSVSDAAELEPYTSPVMRKRLESNLSIASTRFPGAWVNNAPMIPERPSIDIVAQGEFSRPSIDVSTPMSPLQVPQNTPMVDSSEVEEKKSRCVIM